MKPLVVVVFTYFMMVYSKEAPLENLDNFLVYPVEAPTNNQKRDTSALLQSKDQFYDFVEEKLIEHSQALEQLVKSTQENEELTKKLIENLSKKIDKPKMPEKIEVHHKNRRRYMDTESTENDFWRIGKNIPKYGILLKDIIAREARNDADPIPVVEHEPVNDKFMSRRSYTGKPVLVPSLQNNNETNSWCAAAMLCHRTVNPICGFDDNFGYGKFDDVCHMLRVNCYWKYNFALVPNCRPM